MQQNEIPIENDVAITVLAFTYLRWKFINIKFGFPFLQFTEMIEFKQHSTPTQFLNSLINTWIIQFVYFSYFTLFTKHVSATSTSSPKLSTGVNKYGVIYTICVQTTTRKQQLTVRQTEYRGCSIATDGLPFIHENKLMISAFSIRVSSQTKKKTPSMELRTKYQLALRINLLTTA